MRLLLSALGLASLITAGAVVNHNVTGSKQTATELPAEPSGSSASSDANSPGAPNDAPLPQQPTLLDSVAVTLNTGVVVLPVGTYVQVLEDDGPTVIVLWAGHRLALHRDALARRRVASELSAFERITASLHKNQKPPAEPVAPSVPNAVSNRTTNPERAIPPTTAGAKTWTPSQTMLSPRETRAPNPAGAAVTAANPLERPIRPVATSPVVRPAGPVAPAPSTRNVPGQNRPRTLPATPE
jgi:hypothetical protein